MDNEILIKKRYVKGLKLASIILFGLYLLGLTNNIFVPGIETEIVKQLFTTLMVMGVITFGAIGTSVSDKNYNLCLYFAVAMQVAFPLVYSALFNYEFSMINGFELFSGRMMDYAFVGAAGPMVISILFARFYLSIFLSFIFLSLLASKFSQ